jgi:mannose-6-phosphate isomerase-like protein (cupin superfamily)
MRYVTIDGVTVQTVSHNPEIKKRVMVAAGEIPHLTGFSQASFPPGEVATVHVHKDMYEIFYVLHGHGEMSINDTCFPVQAGSCISVAPGEAHEIRNHSDTELVVCYFGVVE